MVDIERAHFRFLVVAKEISLEDVRPGLEKMPDCLSTQTPYLL